MRLALIIDDYLPDSTRVGAKMMHELALELARQGHHPFVITPGLPSQPSALEENELDQVPVLRFRSGPLKDIPKIQRAVNESLLSWRAWRALSGRIKSEKIDGVIYYSPSIFFGPLVRKIKHAWKCPSYLVLRDLFPQWVIDEGMIGERSPIAHYFRFFEQRSYAAADHIGLMSTKNLAFFRQANPRIGQTGVLYNWASQSPSQPPLGESSLRHRLGLQEKVVFFYGGNIGHAQDMANLMRLAIGMRNQEKAHFLFVGQGDEVELVQSFIRQHQLNNTSYLPSIDQESFKKLLCEVDIGLFSLARSHRTHNFPGKLLGYMVNALPILGSVNAGNDLLDVINESGAGVAMVNGDDGALLAAAQRMLADAGWRHQLGENSRKLLIKSFSVESATSTILEALSQ
jgi:glycosyltransferase involved in cell wall biosynthesis